MVTNELVGMFWFVSILSIICIRIIITGAATEYLHKIEVKKRKKGQTIWEWFHYSRFREELPRRFWVLYYTVMYGNLLMILIVLFASKHSIYIDNLIMVFTHLSFLWWLYVIVRTTDYKRGGTNFKKWVPKPPKKKK